VQRGAGSASVLDIGHRRPVDAREAAVRSDGATWRVRRLGSAEKVDLFSNSLLLLRLEETALGAAVVMLAAALVLPLSVGRVARVAARQQLTALADLIDLIMIRRRGRHTAHGSFPLIAETVGSALWA
jgi:hypothetical protein